MIVKVLTHSWLEYHRGVAHSISHGSVREKYLLSFNRESEKSEK